MTPAELQAEILTDPTGIGYAAWLDPDPARRGTSVDRTNDAEIAKLLNAPRTPLLRRTISTSDVLDAIDWRDVVATEEGKLRIILSQPEVPIGQQRIRDALAAALLNTNGTRTRIAALATRQGSRAEQLWGVGTSIHHLDVARALGRVG